MQSLLQRVDTTQINHLSIKLEPRNIYGQQIDNEYLQENWKQTEVKEQTNEMDEEFRFCKVVLYNASLN